MKNQNNKLNFKKNSIIELDNNQLNKVSGGSPVTDAIELITRIATYGTWFGV